MKPIKNKKTLKITIFSAFFIATSVTAASISLASCSSKSNVKIPSTNAGSFSSLNSNILPTVAGVLSSSSGQDSLFTSYINKLLINWFKVVNDSSIEVSYKQWAENAEKAYNDEYKNYKNNKGANWEQLFQQNVLDPVGGTKQAYIDRNIASNVKSSLIDYLFGSNAKEYLGYTSNSGSTNVVTPIKDINLIGLKDIDNSYVNAKTPGTKNNFSFTGKAIAENERKTIDWGYGDFMEYLMDSWIKNALPLPLSMSLWKNGTSETKIKNLFSSYFTQNETPTGFTEGSYAFQYFEGIDNDNAQKLTTTEKFRLLMLALSKGSYVSNKTGLIKLNTEYTEDSSTSLIVPASKLFDGTYVTPFSAAAWYKFSNDVFGIKDDNVYTATSIDETSIMKNFLSYKSTVANPTKATESQNNTGIFKFPYKTTWNNPNTQTESSVFQGEYKNADGIRDVINIGDKATLQSNSTTSPKGSTDNSSQETNQSQLGNFILVRNQFGVHLISIDRLAKLKEAATNGATTDFNTKFNKVCNELRNTFMYYYALDTVQGTTTYNVKESLKTYLNDNFEQVILGYVEKLIDDTANQQDNLFGAKVTANLASVSGGIDYNTNFGFKESSDKNYKDYYDVLSELKKPSTGNDSNKLRDLIDTAKNLKIAKKANDFNQTLKKAIYSNQSTYNNNASATAWINNGIAGVLPFKRDSQSGDFTSLQQLVNSITTNTAPSTSTTTVPSKKVYRNARVNNASLAINFNDNGNATPSDTKTYLTKTKNEYQKAIVSYVNSVDLVVDPKIATTGISTYIYTNNDYINKALLATGSDGTLNSIVYNSYMQKYLYPNGTTKNTLIDNSTIGSNGWIATQIQNAIKSTYYVSNFIGINNLYSQGDWTTQETFLKKAESYWNSNWNESEFKFKMNINDGDFGFNVYNKPSDTENYFKFLITIKYLLSWSDGKNTDGTLKGFEFTKLYDILDNATKTTNNNSGKAMVAWQTMSSIVANPNFGISSATSMSTIQNQMQNDTKFEALPIYLTNSNSYSWLGQINPYSLTTSSNGSRSTKPNGASSSTLTKSSIVYTTSSDYWYSAPMMQTSNKASDSANTSSTGFLGFQLESNGETGVDNKLPSLAFNNSTYSNAIANSGTNEVKYRGMLYSYASRPKIVDYVKNLSTPSLLTSFYDNNLKDSGLPITEAAKKNLNDLINDETNTGTNRVETIQNAIIGILNDTNQVPDIAFDKMTAMPLWNSENNVQSTLFASSDTTGALKNEYIISQFNNQDVQNLISKDSNGKVTLQTGSTGFLGLNSTTFFNAVIMLANASSKLQSQAMDAMMREMGKISVYDIRLTSMLDRSWIANYDDWQKVRQL